MSRLNYEIDISSTAVSGTWSANSSKLVSSLLKQIIVKAATSTTTFEFDITDEKDNVIFTTEYPATGTLREEKDIPVKNILTLRVFNSSVDEAFTGKVCVVEE